MNSAQIDYRDTYSLGGGGLAGETRARAEFTPARANLEADPDLIHNSTLKRLEIDWLVSVVSHRTRG